jgi:hypothetical protein
MSWWREKFQHLGGRIGGQSQGLDPLEDPPGIGEVQPALRFEDQQSRCCHRARIPVDVDEHPGFPVAAQNPYRHRVHAVHEREYRHHHSEKHTAENTEHQTPATVASARTASRRRTAPVVRITVRSSRPRTATTTTAPKVASARLSSRPVRKSITRAPNAAVTAPDRGDREPLMSLTAVCERPPPAGNAWNSPPARFAPPQGAQLPVSVEPVVFRTQERTRGRDRLDKTHQRDADSGW